MPKLTTIIPLVWLISDAFQWFYSPFLLINYRIYSHKMAKCKTYFTGLLILFVISMVFIAFIMLNPSPKMNLYSIE